MSDTRAELARALEAHLRASNGMPDEEEMGDFLIVACGVAIDSQYHPTARYYTTFKDETMLPHVARGLLSKGEEVLYDTEVEGNGPDPLP